MAKKKAAKKATKSEGGFKDLHFKLSVLSALMEDGHFVEEAERLNAKFGKTTKDYTAIKKVMEFYESVEIHAELLATITELLPDGGDLAYVHAVNVWDGEDDLFDIGSIEGIEQLVNLERFEPIAMISQEGIDYAPILGCKKLRKVDMSFSDGGSGAKKVAAELRRRGVEVIE